MGLTGYKPGVSYGIKTIGTDGYNDVVVAVLRSRGHYSGQTLVLQTMSASISDIDGIETNPMGNFTLQVSGRTGGSKSFTCSMDSTSKNYITKVLGSDVYDKDYNSYPLYVFEQYPNLLDSLVKQGLVTGLSLEIVSNSEGDNFLREWDTPASPMVVSEVRGNKVSDLFQVITISDGEAANEEVKVTIQNINIDSGEFDLVVRDFYDTDDNQVVLEKFSRCTMNMDAPGYVARKVGTSDGQYALVSKYIMLNMADNAPSNAFPAGFKGFVTNGDLGGSFQGGVTYKTHYFNAGDTMYTDMNGNPVTTNGDKFKKVSLGLSSQMGSQFDSDLLQYKGSMATTTTKGFHLSVNADSNLYVTTDYDLEGQLGDDNKLTNINYRKFTLAVGGGFDGWDLYRDTRTFGDGYIFGKATYISGDTQNNGVFSTVLGNSDYYAYLKGIETYQNPEAVDINIFATAGINWYDHETITQYAIDVIENDRADSIYIMSSPLFSGQTASSIADQMDAMSFDSNYSATYWPWIQIRDTDAASQLYVPPTGEVLKNIALTDNVSYPWFAVAGYARGIVNSIKATKKLTLDDRDVLYKSRIN